MASPAPSMPFIKNLASSDGKIRTQALDSLKAFLAAKYAAGSGAAATAPLTLDDAQKLWAGLFYALWMADRAPAQQRLCDELAGLPRAVQLPDAAVAVWLLGFWATMARQWTTGIDVLRMDKFLLLVRRVLGAQLVWMRQDGEADPAKAAAAAELGLAVLADWPFNPTAEAPLPLGSSAAQEDGDGDADGAKNEDRGARPRKKSRTAPPTLHVPVGLTLHAVDIWVDEAERALLLGPEAASEGGGADGVPAAAPAPAPLARRIHALVETLAAKTTAPAVRKRAAEALADERLPWVAAAERGDGEAEAKAETGPSSGGLEALADPDEDGSEDGSPDGSWDGFND